jgi:predicted nucleic acid-binding protein
MKFLDASILIEACLMRSPKFEHADALLKPGNGTSAHALAEAYATLSGDKRLKINPHDAAVMVADTAKHLHVESLDGDAVVELLSGALARGISGGSFYDALHAECARRMGCTIICTLNASHFRHVAPDMQVEAL